MPYIELGNDSPGIVGLLRYRPEIGRLIGEMAEVLLRGPSPLTRGERELIAAYVSSLNECRFCASSHRAFAAAQLPEGRTLVDQVCADADAAPVTDKIRALLRIARAVQTGGRSVRADHITAARAAGAIDVEIHDTVLIAAMFCLANRYVDGLAAVTPTDPASYEEAAARIVAHGYGELLPDE
ncbi:carboxymuconolactone decarboxylase family protein [Actinoallomurus rhizosphaericola]|uniref:carboxymuconolactone decarboxylase family protein n=1 Tax=Actinoallomurus rhizosphaericola TaxID=2952536 RepID=UPI002092B1DA|nr:peroxidase-related enzyme [Actinoallomurus rhizosphaericola]MCO5999469.1 peroxidase-related enzyme [Actinoallomurus rhizosphaericola]